MSTTIFFAVQCYRCSTMQVKQKNNKYRFVKSSNKWRCVVCNEKQSVRKVFAEGYAAKDVGSFVQSFNMSREVSDEVEQGLEEEEEEEERREEIEDYDGFDVSQSGSSIKRRTDWIEYLEEVEKENARFGDNAEREKVEELTKEMFKRPKLKSTSSSESSGDGRFYQPVEKQALSQANKPKKSQSTAAVNTSKWSGYIGDEGELIEATATRKYSKWNCYMTNNNDNVDDPKPRIHGKSWADDCLDAWEAVFDDHKVEDDVHPDFM